MGDSKLKVEKNKVDKKEFEIPETLFIRDIENKVFQSIILHCLSQIEGISLVEGNFIDHLLGRSSEGVKGIDAEQDAKNQSVNVRVEVNVFYGLSIPNKAEEIQTQITESITRLTGLHVASVHVIFRNVVSPEQAHKIGAHPLHNPSTQIKSSIEEEYLDEF